MTINRFTNFSPAKYNPMGLEELMQVPMMKRMQHDQLAQGAAETQAALSQLDYLGVHSDKVGGTRQDLEDRLNKQVEEINARGITNTSKSDFMRLNADYQAAMGPQGVFGKAATAKSELERVKQEALATAIQLGNDPAETTKRINEAVAAYEQTQLESDDITNISPIMPPKAQDLQADIAQAVQIAGHSIKTERGDEGYNIRVDNSTGQPIAYAVTESGQVITKDNKSALGYQLANLSEKWLREGGEGYRYAQWNSLDMDSIQNQLINSMSSARVREVRDNRQKGYSNIGGLNTTQRGDTKIEENNMHYTTSGYTNQLISPSDSVSDMRSRVAEVRRSKNVSPKEREEARLLEETLNEAEKSLKGEGFDREGNPLPTNNRYKYYKDKLEIVDQVKEKLEVDGKKIPNPLMAFGQIRSKHRINTGNRYGYEKLSNGEYALFDLGESSASGQTTKRRLSKGTITAEEYQKLKKAAEVYDEFERYEDQYIKDYMSRQGQERTDVIIPFKNTAEYSTMVLNAMQSLTANNSRPSIVTYFDKEGKSEDLDLDEDQRRGVMNMLLGGDREAVKKINVSKLGSEAGITIRFNPSEGNKIKIPGLLTNKGFGDGEGIEMFIPVTTLNDPVTGQRHAPTQVFEILGGADPQLKYEIEKLVTTGGLSATPNEADLGKAAIPTEALFPKNTVGPEDSLIDFKVEYGETGRYIAPYILDNEGHKEIARWDSIITPTLLEDNDETDEVIDAMLSSGLIHKMMESSRYIMDGGETIYNKHNIGKNPTEAEVRAFLEDMSRREMRLRSHRDILEVSKFFKIKR